jgi:hypothetical protein
MSLNEDGAERADTSAHKVQKPWSHPKKAYNKTDFSSRVTAVTVDMCLDEDFSVPSEGTCRGFCALYSTINELFEVCSPLNIMSISKEQKYREIVF